MPVEFIFDGFGPDNGGNLILQNAAITDNRTLKLTSVDTEEKVGRALYRAPIQLSDGHDLEASFETTFNFRITAPDDGLHDGPGDGLAFFIATPETEIPPHSFGKYLGLFKNASDKVVAVEFDTFCNTADAEVQDPNYIHIGININNIRSSAVGNWNWKDKETATATVKYDAPSKTLSVRTSYSNSGTPDALACSVDLTTCLPKSVRVGFSASTGQRYTQTTEVLYWSFNSNVG